MTVENPSLSPQGQALRMRLIERSREYANEHGRPDLSLEELLPSIGNKLSHIKYAGSSQKGSEETFKMYAEYGFNTPEELLGALKEVVGGFKAEFPHIEWDKYVTF